MKGATRTAKKAWSEAELQALPEDGYLHEVVDGELIMPGFRYPIRNLFKEWDWD